jgi:uncharacterized protein (TIGR02597 family)
VKFPQFLIPSLVAVATLGALTYPSHGQTSVATVPQGFVNITIKPSTDGTTPTLTQFSAPLQPAATITGQSVGRLSGVAASTLSNSSAGWTASALSSTTAPFYVKVRTGSGAGRIFRITANTSTDLTVDTQGFDLTTLGIATGASGDSYEIFPGYTLLSLLGTPTEGVIGGNSTQFSANQTDKVLINDSIGIARFFYYDTSVSQWRRLGSATNQNTLPISPFTGMTYYRVSTTPLSFTFTGKVPDTNAKIAIPTTGTTLLASYFPATTTLASLALNTLPTWRKLGDAGVTLDDTDRVLAEDSIGIVRSFYFDGTSWKRVGSNSVQDSVAISAGSTIYLTRFGSGTNNETWARTLPYSLN